MHPELHGLFCAMIIGLILMFIVPRSAEACSGWGPEFQGAVPADGAAIPPDTHFSFWFKPEGASAEAELVNETGDSIDVEVESNRVGEAFGAVQSVRIAPESPLEPGSYTLTFHGQSFEYQVTDDKAPPPGPPEQLHWTDGTYRHPDTCYDKYWHEIEIAPGEERSELWYEIEFLGDGPPVTSGQPGLQSLRQNIDADIDCIAVRAVTVGGRQSEPVEVCEPDVCARATWGSSPVNEVECDGATDNRACRAAGSTTVPVASVLIFLLVVLMRRTNVRPVC